MIGSTGLELERIEKALQQAVAAMGVKRLVLCGSYRVERAYFGSPALAPEAVRAELVLGLERLEWKEEALDLSFRPGAPVPPERVAALIATSAGAATLAGEHRVRWRWRAGSEEERLEEARALLRQLEGA